jgi:hypothetical protein
MNDALVSTNASFVLTKGADARLLRDDFDQVAVGASEKNWAAGLFAQLSTGWSFLRQKSLAGARLFLFYFLLLGYQVWI